MPAKGKISWASLSKGVWCCLSASILLLGWGSCFADARCADAESTFLPFMVILSFPAGPVAILLMYLLVDGGTPVSFTLLWMAVFLGGYVQWSMITANVGHPQVLSLGLEQPVERRVSLKECSSAPSSQPKRQRKRRRLVSAFDKQGRTPLERAIRKELSDR